MDFTQNLGLTLGRKPVPYLCLHKRFTARFPVSYHFTVRPFVVIDWVDGGASEGIWKPILFTGLVPTKSSTFAVLQFYHIFSVFAGFIYRGANQGMGILFAGFPATMRRKRSDFHAAGEDIEGI